MICVSVDILYWRCPFFGPTNNKGLARHRDAGPARAPQPTGNFPGPVGLRGVRPRGRARNAPTPRLGLGADPMKRHPRPPRSVGTAESPAEVGNDRGWTPLRKEHSVK